MISHRPRYQVDLSRLQGICEANYLRLQSLLINCEPRGQRCILLSHGAQALGHLHLQILECCRYTTVLQVSRDTGVIGLPVASLYVRSYHDVRLAEVVSSAPGHAFQGRYPYPNARMYQPDEKTQLNGFLGEWLTQCQRFGHEAHSVVLQGDGS